MAGRKDQKYWALIIISSILFLALLVFLLHIAEMGVPVAIGDFPWYSFMRSTLLSSPFLLGVVYVDYKVVQFINGNKWLLSHFPLRLAFELILIVVLAWLFVIIGNIPFYDENTVSSFFNNLLYDSSTIAAILLNIFIIIAVEFFVQNRKSMVLQEKNAQMQYQQLKSQINPHFLFNSLNVLVSLINKDSVRATDYTKKLSDVYRYVLTHDMEDVVSVSDELEFIHNYIEILQIRFGNGLQIKFDIRTADMQKRIPPMSLQVLVENAVKHNATSLSDPLHIEIITDGSDILVSNNIIPRFRVEDSKGIGLNNLKGKYHLIAGKSIRIERDKELFVVKLPLL